MIASGPLLALVQVPADLRPAIENVLARVWRGRMAAVQALDGADDAPALAVVASHVPEEAFRVARAGEAVFPEVPFLAVVEGARKLRNQPGSLPGNVGWALWTDELEARTVGLAMRYVIEVATRRRIADRLQAARPLADMGFVASSVAHEIGNPLTGLLTNLEILRAQLADAVGGRASPDPATLLALATDALDGAHHVGRIAADLGRASRHHGRLAVTDLRGVIDTARRLANELLGGIEVRSRFRNVPQVRVDETRLCQVLLNLLKNAAQALQGRPGPIIDLETEVVGDRVVVRISDNGPGIAPSMARRLFEPWQTTKADGTGIGLALCRRYLAEMGGTIEHVDRPGQGARFEITLVPGVGARPSRPTLVPDVAPRGARILVVDDTPLVRRAIQRALQGEHHVEEADGADQALAQLEAAPFDVVMIDLHMPGRSGIDVYEEITERLPDRVRKVVFLSGAFGGVDLAYLEQRNLPWVRKPMGAVELRELVTELISTP